MNAEVVTKGGISEVVRQAWRNVSDNWMPVSLGRTRLQGAASPCSAKQGAVLLYDEKRFPEVKETFQEVATLIPDVQCATPPADGGVQGFLSRLKLYQTDLLSQKSLCLCTAG